MLKTAEPTITREFPEPRRPDLLEAALAKLLRQRLGLRPLVSSPDMHRLHGSALEAERTDASPAVQDYPAPEAE